MVEYNGTLLLIGMLLLLFGLSAPAETTETTYEVVGEPQKETNDNEYKAPMTVIGGVCVIAAFAISQKNTVSDDRPPDE